MTDWQSWPEFKQATADAGCGDRMELRLADRLTPWSEQFILTAIGGITYWISLDFGYAYTRPQLEKKYSRVSGGFRVIRHPNN